MITLINGKPQTPAGLIVPNGSVGFQLNCDATIVAAPFGFISGDIEVVFQFDASGLIQPNAPATAAQIYSNKELNPQNSVGLATYYLVTFYDANGARINQNPMWWQFPEAAGATVDIGEMTPISTVGGNVIFYPTAFGGGGSVTSVAFVGDGVVLSNAPSTPVTTAGNIAATLLTQAANTVLAGPTSGPAATPTFRAITASDLPVGTNVWSSLSAPVANLTLATTTFNTTFTSTSGTAWTWQNLTAATNITDQPSPAIKLIGNFWDSIGLASVTKTFTIQEAGGFLKFTQAGGLSQVFPYQFDSSIAYSGSIQGALAQFAFQTGNAGAVYSISAVANASGGLTTYTAVVGAGGQPNLGQNIAITGFVAHGSNNGTFVVHDATLTTITVYSSGGIAETHAATGTLDSQYAGLGGFTTNISNATGPVFSIFGVSQPAPFQLNPYPNSPAFVSTVKGDAVDASYWRIVNDGVTGNHGLEIGAIIDGTGAAPMTVLLGHFNGSNGFAVQNQIAATGGANQSSPIFSIAGNVWDGSKSITDIWTFQNIIGAGTLPGQTLQITCTVANGVVQFGTSVQTGQLTSAAAFVGGDLNLTSAAATNVVNISSFKYRLDGSFWNGAAPVSTISSIQEVIGAGTNPSETLVISNSGAFLWNGVSVQGPLSLGLAGVSSVLSFVGLTSGTATITGPAIAGTAANPFLFSNGVQLPSGTGLSWNADLFLSRLGANSLAVGNGIGASNGSISVGGISNGGTTTTSALAVSGSTATFGTAGSAAGTLTLAGATSGTCTITAPAVAGTIANAFAFSNSINLPAATGISFNGDVFISRLAGSNLLFGNAIGNSNCNIFASSLGISGNAATYGPKITQYNGIATVGNGVGAEVATVDLTAQTASIGTTTLYATQAANEQHRVQWNAKVTTPAGVSSTLGPLTITYTDPDGVVQTITAQAQNSAGADETSDTGNTTTTVMLGRPLFINCKASTNIQYAFTYASNAAAAMNYNLHIRVERM